MAIDFPGGTDDEIDIGNGTSLQITGAITIMLWVYSDGYQNTELVSKQKAADRGFSLQVDQDVDPDIYANFIIATSSSTTLASGWPTTKLTHNQWHHLVGVFVPSTAIQIWQDGGNMKENTTAIPATMYDPANTVVITGRPEASAGWDGKVDDVRIYNRALSQREIENEFAVRGRNPILDGLVSRWTMREKAVGVAATGAGSIKDIGPNRNDGTPVTANCIYYGSELSFIRPAQ